MIIVAAKTYSLIREAGRLTEVGSGHMRKIHIKPCAYNVWHVKQYGFDFILPIKGRFRLKTRV